MSVFLARHRVRSPRLPGALAHVVADRPAEHAGQRVALGQVLRLLADHRDELAFVLHALGRVRRDHDRLAMRDQRIVGAIADIGGGRQIGLLAALFRRLDDVLGVIEPGAVEGARLDRHQQLDRRQAAAASRSSRSRQTGRRAPR